MISGAHERYCRGAASKMLMCRAMFMSAFKKLLVNVRGLGSPSVGEPYSQRRAAMVIDTSSKWWVGPEPERRGLPHCLQGGRL
jgi:hypothetical protein